MTFISHISGFVSLLCEHTLANIVYQKACEIWDQAVAEEEKLIEEGELSEENALTHNMKNFQFLDNAPKLVEKYHSFKTATPTVLSHEEFEKAKEGKQVLYRGIHPCEDERLSLNEMSKQLKSGNFKEGFEKNGIFSSTIKHIKDSNNLGLRPSSSAECYARLKDGQSGIICSFFYDPNKAVVIKDIEKLTNKYYELYLKSLDLNTANDKESFLFLRNGFCGGAKLCAQLLGADVAISCGGWQQQIFNPGVLTFDEEDEITSPYNTDNILMRYSSVLLESGIYLVTAGELNGTIWHFSENGCTETLDAAETINNLKNHEIKQLLSKMEISDGKILFEEKDLSDISSALDHIYC